MKLDASTVILLVFLGSILSSITFLLIYIFKFSVRGVSSWLVGSFANSISLYFFAMQGILSDLLTYYLSNMLIIYGFLLFWKGSREFTKKNQFHHLFWLIPLAMIIPIDYSFTIKYGFELRVILMSIILGIITFCTALDLFKTKNGVSQKIMGGVFFGYFLFTVIKTILVTSSLISGNSVDPMSVAIYTYLFSFVIIFLYTFGSLLMIGERLQATLKDQTIRDPLTDIYNRRGFELFAKREFITSKLHNQNLFLLIIDLDNFKHINDAHGHSFGDRVLRRFTEVISGDIKKRDMFFRIGGEEFVVLLADTELREAKIVAERLRKKIEGCSVKKDGRSIYFTISIGITQLKNNDEQIATMVERADRALYKAKSSGKNMVSIYS